MPSERVALAVAAEWDAQNKHVRPITMPMVTITTVCMSLLNPQVQMTLATTALDVLPSKRGQVVDAMMSHLKTDSVWFG